MDSRSVPTPNNCIYKEMKKKTWTVQSVTEVPGEVYDSTQVRRRVHTTKEVSVHVSERFVEQYCFDGHLVCERHVQCCQLFSSLTVRLSSSCLSLGKDYPDEINFELFVRTFSLAFVITGTFLDGTLLRSRVSNACSRRLIYI